MPAPTRRTRGGDAARLLVTGRKTITGPHGPEHLISSSVSRQP
jgi:hypothetical protein